MFRSVVNFRDAGGLPSQAGGTVRSDRLYRSGALATIQPGELDRLLGLDFALVADLRYPAERDREPSPWPTPLALRVLSLAAGQQSEAPHMAPLRAGTLDEDQSERLYLKIYRNVPFDPSYQALFSGFLKRLADVDGRVLVHCSAGKDRTGMLVALVHHALGVSRAHILADYMKSATDPGLAAAAGPMAEDMIQRFGAQIRVELMQALLKVRESWLAAFFDEVEARCGAMDAYLDSLGLTEPLRWRLREKLLTT